MAMLIPLFKEITRSAVKCISLSISFPRAELNMEFVIAEEPCPSSLSLMEKGLVPKF